MVNYGNYLFDLDTNVLYKPPTPAGKPWNSFCSSVINLDQKRKHALPPGISEMMLCS